MTDNFRATHLPYCLQLQSNGNYIILNRFYKPIGFNTREHLNYSDYPIEIKFTDLTTDTANKLSCDNDTKLENIFLYNDNSVPTDSDKNMQEYLNKLEILAKLKIEVPS